MPDKSKTKSIHYPFWFGGSASCMAAILTHPLDLVKVRLQTSAIKGPKPGMLVTMVNIVRGEGILAIYSGLSASLLRQATYSTTRFGVYAELKSRLVAPNEKPSFATLLSMATISGVMGGLAGNPADIVNVRMQQDRANPAHERRNYKHALDGLVRMLRTEGAASLFRGVWPNTMRAALMSASQLATYDQFKGALLAHGMDDGLLLHSTASMLSGVVATTVCSPADVIKTRIMSSTDKTGIITLLKDTFRREGYTWMLRGWIPSFMRLGPQTILTFIFLEQHQKMWRMLHPEQESEMRATA